ncbi:MAG: phytanoyl-CoA dioxygenase family protein [Proteobacteria bacterium]|nr:phytanoyl-CoA dioxygenase family protein [Pseudomonadota bacterium]
MTGTAGQDPRPGFEAVSNDAPKRLTRRQIDDYNELGYVGGLDVFTSAEVHANRASFDRLLDGIGESNAYAINCFQGRSRTIWDLCTDERILDCVEDILGPDIVCWASHYFCKMPHDPVTVPWHQDAPYWHLAPARTVTAWLAIDDSDEENSAVRFIPGTHRLGFIEHGESRDSTVLGLEIENAEELGDVISNDLRAGQISLHADTLAHGSLPNTSSRRRCGLTIRYCAPSVGFTDDDWARGVESIVCRGSADGTHWRHVERPDGDDLSALGAPLNIGGN